MSGVNAVTPILGPVLKVGTIPSRYACPNFLGYEVGSAPMDSGLITLSSSLNPSLNNYFIGPDGFSIDLTGDSNTERFINDTFQNRASGSWFDTQRNCWFAIPNAYYKYNAYVSSYGIYNNKTFYSNSSSGLVLAALSAGGYFENTNTANPGGGELGSGFSNNFCYAGPDQFIAVNMPLIGCYQSIPTEISYPYGVTGMDFVGSVTNVSGYSSCPPYPFALSNFDPGLISIGPSYRPSKISPLFCFGGLAVDRMLAYKSGNWFGTVFYASPIFLGRLWNGFVLSYVFKNYTGCVYTEDCITYYPLIDITNNLDFTNPEWFGLSNYNIGRAVVSNYFNSGFGFAYLANYTKGISNFTQAAYKIYPAFNFRPLVPDSFYVPSICGCNRRSNRA